MLDQVESAVAEVPDDRSRLNHSEKSHCDGFGRQVPADVTRFLAGTDDGRHVGDDILNDAE